MSIDLEKLSNLSFKIDDENLTLLQQNTEIVLTIDDFEDTKTIKFTKCGYGIIENSLSHLDPYFKMYVPECNSGYEYLGFNFVNNNGFSYLDVVLRGSEISLASGDYFIILFEDGTKEKYVFNKPLSGNKYISSNFIALKGEDLFNLLSKDIDKVKVVSNRKNLYSIYVVNDKDNKPNEYFKYKYTTRVTGQLLLKYMVFRFIEFNLMNKI